VAISLFTLSSFYYWFVIANRYVVFLYGHLGATPFDPRTSSRYWMAGLVATGAVMVLYTVVNWSLGRLAGVYYRRYYPLTWWRIWLICVLPVSGGVLLITMTQNQPTLPFPLAAACVGITLVGLALALPAGQLAAQQPGELLWLIGLGSGFLPILLLLRVVELPARGLAQPDNVYGIAVGSIVVGIFWLMILIYARRWRRKPSIPWYTLLTAGLCLSYLFAPLAHYLFLTPPAYRYITASTNIFAFDWRTQALVWLTGLLMAIGVSYWQSKLKQHQD